MSGSINGDASGFDPVRVRIPIAGSGGHHYSVIADVVKIPGKRMRPRKIPPLGLGADLNSYRVGIQSSCLLIISWSPEKISKSISLPNLLKVIVVPILLRSHHVCEGFI